MTLIDSGNEWSKLRSVVVGSAAGANWPTDLLKIETAWHQTPIPQGPVPAWILEETDRELDEISRLLIGLGVEVHRPRHRDFVATGGMYNYCPRDRLLILGSTVIVPQMMMACRNQEVETLDFVTASAGRVIHMPHQPGMVLDAANVCRLDDRLLILESASGSRSAIDWLNKQLPDHEIEICNFYSGIHIDSTIVPVRPGLVLLNASRVNENNCPAVFDGWHKVWVQDVVARDFYQYPYASKWIGMNLLVIDPGCVMVDRIQIDLIRTLEKHAFTVIPVDLSHSRTLGGGLHCVTLDLWRQS